MYSIPELIHALCVCIASWSFESTHYISVVHFKRDSTHKRYFIMLVYCVRVKHFIKYLRKCFLMSRKHEAVLLRRVVASLLTVVIMLFAASLCVCGVV